MDLPAKAITVQQPWAWAIMHGGKNVENRSQMLRYRGPLAIHAGMRISGRGQRSPLIDAAWQAWTAEHGRPDPYYRLGVILGVVDLVDVHPAANCCRPWGESIYVKPSGEATVHVVHLVLEDPRPLDVPIPCSGRLGLWTIPELQP